MEELEVALKVFFTPRLELAVAIDLELATALEDDAWRRNLSVFILAVDEVGEAEEGRTREELLE